MADELDIDFSAEADALAQEFLILYEKITRLENQTEVNAFARVLCESGQDLLNEADRLLGLINDR